MSLRNPDILIACEMMHGSLDCWENCFGGLSGYSDDQLLAYITGSWAEEYGIEVKVMTSFDKNYWSQELKGYPDDQLKRSLAVYSGSAEYAPPSYGPLICDVLVKEMQKRGIRV